MDDRGRLAQSLNLDAWSSFLAARWPRGAGWGAAALMIALSCAYGIVLGDHISAAAGILKQARDWAANAVGLRIQTVALTGNQHVSREEVLAIAGVTGTTSLLFLDVEQTRGRLKSNPWISEATVLKLYPRELQITIVEREAFALWQKNGAVSVIAQDGTVLEPYVAPRLLRLPLVVGAGAERKAKELLSWLDRHPALRDSVRACVFVGERRWNLRLKNGLEVRLPEAGPAAAIETLVALDAEKPLLTRDITVVDLRLADRVTVRLSDAAAQARMEAIKEKPKKKAGGPA
jgi:cell division protein FtsQ